MYLYLTASLTHICVRQLARECMCVCVRSSICECVRVYVCEERERLRPVLVEIEEALLQQQHACHQ